MHARASQPVSTEQARSRLDPEESIMRALSERECEALRERAARMFRIAKEDARRAAEYRTLKRHKRLNRALATSALQSAVTLLACAKAIRAGDLDGVFAHYHDGHLSAISRKALDRCMEHPAYAGREGAR